MRKESVRLKRNRETTRGVTCRSEQTTVKSEPQDHTGAFTTVEEIRDKKGIWGNLESLKTEH